MFIKTLIYAFIFLFFFSACTNQVKNEEQTSAAFKISHEVFGKTPDGKEVQLFTLLNKNGMVVKISNYGGIITSIQVPDKEGKMEDVVLGYDNFGGYLEKGNPFFGCLVGRYANRIAKGKFVIDGVEYKLALNDGKNTLHGGLKGFDKQIWDYKEIMDSVSVALELSYLSKDGEEGYPGNLKVRVVYTLNNDNEIKIEYFAETDKPTPVNLTNHTYFNLMGNAKSDVLSHEIKIYSKSFTPVGKDLIPTGEIKPVQGTAFDFSELKPIGKDIAATGMGYDHNFVVNENQKGLEKIAEVVEPQSKRKVEVFTTQPGVQFYTGNFLDGTVKGKGGQAYLKNYGFCLETQHYPDSPNQKTFPNSILKPGESYNQTTVYRFSVEK